ncbi:MAG: sigma-70 family RNA polymerase sigma factor [Arachidicoccus sp.]|nr:sigma-70 family RNA polymerase sigma factor [Arachidicoccus sp.]
MPTNLEKDWHLLAEGNGEGLHNCFNFFYDDLYRLGFSIYKNPELVKEAINNLFIELWKIRHKLTYVQNIQAYVIGIYKNILYKTYSYNKSVIKIDEQHFSISNITEQSYETILIMQQQDKDLKKRLENALNTLSERQKQLIKMRYFDQISIEKIAVETGLTERTIYNTMHSAIKNLKDILILYPIAMGVWWLIIR